MGRNAGLDDSQYQAMVARLTGDEMRKANGQAVLSGARVIGKATVANFASGTRFKAVNEYRPGKGGAARRLRLAPVRLFKKGREPFAVVRITEDFRARFFELGTRTRTTKGRLRIGRTRVNGHVRIVRKGKPSNRGRITARRYFESAVRSNGRSVLDSLGRRVRAAVIRIAGRKG